MAKVAFTQNIQRHVACPETEAPGNTVAEVLGNVFASNPRARSYVLDEHGGLRKHMIIFIDGTVIRDRERLTDTVDASSRIYVFQSLSGG